MRTLEKLIALNGLDGWSLEIRKLKTGSNVLVGVKGEIKVNILLTTLTDVNELLQRAEDHYTNSHIIRVLRAEEEHANNSK